MNSGKLIMTVIAVVAVVGGLLLGGPILAVPMLVVTFVAFRALRHGRPIAPEAAAWSQRWYAWFAVAAALFVIGGTMLLTADDGELSTPAWAVWTVSWVSGAAVAVVGLGLGATRIAQQRRT